MLQRPSLSSTVLITLAVAGSLTLGACRGPAPLVDNPPFLAASSDIIDFETHAMGTEAMRTVYDPEIPVNIYALGLIYDVEVSEEYDVKITMTLTSPNCPVAETLPVEVEEKVKSIKTVNNVSVQIVFEPPWTKEMMSEEAKLELGML